MQTFLPYDDFAESARVIDSARLGKQRLEALQALRALVLPVYGWSTHPAARMWRGHVPALTAYTLTVIDEWTSRGNLDAIRPFVLEFAPDVEGVPQNGLRMPSWLGSSDFHDSHRSNLVRKVPELYRPLFPDVADDLPYLWPEPDAPDGVDRLMPESPTVWVVRPRSAEELEEWTATEIVALPGTSPTGTRSKAWTAQLGAFSALAPGDRLVLVRSELDRYPVGVVSAAPLEYGEEGAAGVRVAIDLADELERSAFAHPVLLQDPRSVFETSAPR